VKLEELGWNDFFEEKYQSLNSPNFDVGRIAIEHKQRYVVYSQAGELTGEITGKLLFNSDNAADLPKVGDWVLITIFEDEKKAVIHDILPRKTSISRNFAGNKTEEQVIVANIDVVFIVQGLDNDFNPRRLERYLVLVKESGADPVIVLNKTDLEGNIDDKLNIVSELSGDTPVVPISAKENNGMDVLKDHITSGKTFAFVGSSGAGKSTIINALLGKELLKTQEVRTDDSRGRHTTTHREMVIMPGGGILIDTPGMREIQLWTSEDGLDNTFSEIERLSVNCHFSDCTHTNENKCAVLNAVEEGDIPEDRLKSYYKLKKELRYLNSKVDENAAQKEKQRLKKVFKGYKQVQKVAKARKRGLTN